MLFPVIKSSRESPYQLISRPDIPATGWATRIIEVTGSAPPPPATEDPTEESHSYSRRLPALF